MLRRVFNWVTILVVVVDLHVFSTQGRVHGKEYPPNIVFIVADDLGWNDVGWNNPSMITPYMNKLARKGVILDNLYVMPLCSPSRAAFMTGYYPYHLGLQNSVITQTFPKYVPQNVTMLAEKLKEQGYKTHVVGKWDLGNCNVKYTPTRRGFDDFMGTYNGAINHYTRVVEGGVGVNGAYDFRLDLSVYRPEKEYLTNTLSRRAVDIISKHDRKDPLFLYVPFVSPHTPLQAPEKYSDLYGCIENTNRRIFSGMVTALDKAVGWIVNALKKHNLMENTLIFFMSDNGGSNSGGGNNLPFRGGKSTLWEGGTKSSSFLYSENLLQKKGYRNSRIIHEVDIFPTFVSLAGGTVDDKIDGKNQWPALSYNYKSARDEFVYNINERRGEAVIRVGDLKLMEGIETSARRFQLADDFCEGRHSKTFIKRTYYGGTYNTKWKSRQFDDQFERDSCEEMGKISSYRLYNITRDPEERFNIACSQPDKLNFLIKRLEHYKKSLVLAQEDTNDPGRRPAVIKGVVSHRWC